MTENKTIIDRWCDEIAQSEIPRIEAELRRAIERDEARTKRRRAIVLGVFWLAFVVLAVIVIADTVRVLVR